MMLTIHGLPISVKYHDLKSLIKERCNISDFILDNLVPEGDGTKKVRIGVADESEGSYLMKSLNGFRMMGNILRVMPIGKTQSSNSQQNFNQQGGGGYTPRNDYQNQGGPNYNNQPMEPAGRSDMMHSDTRPDPWSQNQGNSWGPRTNQQGPGTNQVPGPNRTGQPPVQQNNYNNYQQSGPQGMNTPYGQGQGGAVRGGPQPQRPYDQPDHYQGRAPVQNQGNYQNYPKNDMPDCVVRGGRHPEGRSHVLRSVEIVDEPLARPAPAPAPAPATGAAPTRYQPSYEHHKPITIMKDNFQGPNQYNDRPNQGSYQGLNQGRPVPHSGPHSGPHSRPHSGPHSSPVAAGPGHQMGHQGSSWGPNIPDRAPMTKPSPTFERKYPEPAKPMGGPLLDTPRNIDLNRGYDKPGPRFSPRRDIDALGRRLPSPGREGILLTPGRLPSPGRRLPSPGRRMPSPGRRMPSPGRRMPSPGRRMPSPGRRMPSPGRRMPSPGRRMPSPGGRMPSPGRRIPSPGRRMPSPGRRMPSPGRRMPSPGRRMPSPGRRMPSPGRRMPSPGRRMPSPGRRMPSPGKRMSPGRRISPGRRPHSPLKRLEPDRYSPGRRLDKPVDKYDDRLKDVRPAYDSAQASNQMYSGGYRPSLHQNVQYPVGGRQSPPWQDRAPLKKDDVRMPKFEPRIGDVKRPLSPQRSRSPLRRERSPLRDRFKKRSPSPRSPRRSWALEKRRSPVAHEAPPPPMWPGQDGRDDFRRFPERPPEDKPKHVPVWEPRRIEDERRFDEVRPREDVRREPAPRDRFPSREPRFEPREEPRREDIPKRFERDFHDVDRHGGRRSREDFVREDFRREDERKLPKFTDTIGKEFEDVVNRANEFKKRTEELRKGRRDEREKGIDRNFDRRDPNPGRGRSRERQDFSPRDESRDKPEWKTNKDRMIAMGSEIRAKRDKAASEIATKITDKHGGQLVREAKDRVIEELKLSIGKKLQDIFGYDDISFIEMVVKFNAKIDSKEEAKMFKDIVSSLPSHLRELKRTHEPSKTEVPAKKKAADSLGGKVPDWQPNVLTAGVQMVLPAPTVQIPNPGLVSMEMMQQMMVSHQMMVPGAGFPTTFEPQPVVPNPQQQMQEEYATQQMQRNYKSPPKDEGYNLYLCKDDFEPYTPTQAEYLKRFLVTQLMNAATHRGGWAPDFTLKGLQSNFRYEVVARDDATKNWLLSLDFNEFELFNVLVYTKEELWYERAAVWLPGHSRYRALEPIEKLKLQNKKLEGVNIAKWKFVKKIVTVKGTRVYVDMPPSSARALEKHKMLLSYELQKVSVFLKAVAVDKEAFDAGLREPSVTETSEIVSAVQNSPMPSIGNDHKIVKLCLKGNKGMSIVQARKVKEMIIYRIFKYHQDNPKGCKTDFLKFGFSQPGYFCIEPENDESRTWLTNLEIGKLNRHEIAIVGGDLKSTKYIKMSIYIHRERSHNPPLVFERLKQSNQGVKGLNFSLWKNFTLRSDNGIFHVEMDIDSIETIIKMNYKLDYIEDRMNSRHRSDNFAKVKYEATKDRLSDVLKKMKAEMTDSYDVANMDIASSSEGEEDIIYMGETRQ